MYKIMNVVERLFMPILVLTLSNSNPFASNKNDTHFFSFFFLQKSSKNVYTG